MLYLRAFIAGMIVPSIILPLFLCIAILLGTPQVLSEPFLHWIPVLWGIWNILYFMFFKKTFPSYLNFRLLLWGALLGLIIASVGVFWLHLPQKLNFPSHMYWLPLLIGPILYAILWRWLVKPLNIVLGLPAG